MTRDESIPVRDFTVTHAFEGRSEPFGGLDGGVRCSRRQKKLVVREARLSPKLLETLHPGLAEGFPIRRGEVHRFVEVESVVEACVVGLRKRNDELSGSLVK